MDSIGATGIVARNITGTNISAESIGATGIVASTIRTNYIGVTGLVATNITGTNISADYIGVTGIVASTMKCSATASADYDVVNKLYIDNKVASYLFESMTAVAIASTSPVNRFTNIIIPIGTWMFEASVLVEKSSCMFKTVSPLSKTRLTYVGIFFVGSSNTFETTLTNYHSGEVSCGVIGGTRVLTITTAQTVQLRFQAIDWTISGAPTFTLYWSAIRIA